MAFPLIKIWSYSASIIILFFLLISSIIDLVFYEALKGVTLLATAGLVAVVPALEITFLDPRTGFDLITVFQGCSYY